MSKGRVEFFLMLVKEVRAWQEKNGKKACFCTNSSDCTVKNCSYKPTCLAEDRLPNEIIEKLLPTMCF